MSEIMQAPENLDELMTQPAYVECGKNYSKTELQQELDDAGVEYRSSDNKDVLVWRFVNFVDSVGGAGEPKQAATEQNQAKEDDLKAPPVVPATLKDSDEDKSEVSKRETTKVSVYNKSAYNLYEPVSCTLLKPRETTEIEITELMDRDLILSNLHQISRNRGKALTIEV